MNVFELKKLFASLSGEDPSAQDVPNAPLTMTASYAQKLYQQLEMGPPDVQFYQEAIKPGPDDQALIQLHAHPFYELIYCREPSGMEYLLRHTICKLEQGDVILIPPGVSHRLLLPEQLPSVYSWDVVWFSRKYMDSIIHFFPEESLDALLGTPVFHSTGEDSAMIGEVFRYGIQEAMAQKPGCSSAMAGSALLVLSLLYRISQASVPASEEKPVELIDQILSYVEDHLSEKISVSQVAKQFYVSESTVCQTFRKKLGISFYRCLTQRRLVLAKALIKEGLSMDAAAQRAGFSDYSVFYRAFKREFGSSPREYRRKILQIRE